MYVVPDPGANRVDVDVVDGDPHVVLRRIPRERDRRGRGGGHPNVRGRGGSFAISLDRQDAARGPGEGEGGKEGDRYERERRVLLGGLHSPRVVGRAPSRPRPPSG